MHVHAQYCWCWLQVPHDDDAFVKTLEQLDHCDSNTSSTVSSVLVCSGRDQCTILLLQVILVGGANGGIVFCLRVNLDIDQCLRAGSCIMRKIKSKLLMYIIRTFIKCIHVAIAETCQDISIAYFYRCRVLFRWERGPLVCFRPLECSCYGIVLNI